MIKKSRRSFLLATTIVSLSVHIAGCTSPDDDPTSAGPSPDFGTKIGPAGGQITLPSMATMVVPPGALKEELTFFLADATEELGGKINGVATGVGRHGAIRVSVREQPFGKISLEKPISLTLPCEKKGWTSVDTVWHEVDAYGAYCDGSVAKLEVKNLGYYAVTSRASSALVTPTTTGAVALGNGVVVTFAPGALATATEIGAFVKPIDSGRAEEVDRCPQTVWMMAS